MSTTFFSSDVLTRLRRSVLVAGVLFLSSFAGMCGDDDDDDGGTGPSADCIDEINYTGLPFDEGDVESLGTDDSDSGSLSENDVDDDGYFADIYVIGADSNGDLTITANPSGFDLVLLMFDENFELINGADADDPDATEELTQPVDDNACYIAVVTSYEQGETGSYSISTEID
jgi:hypothetical protein